MGRRIQRTSTTGGTTKFVYDGADVLRDLDGNGSTIADYLNAPGIDNKLRQTTSGTTSYFVTDHLGTTRGLTDAGGNLAASIGYDSYGNITSGSSPTRYTYTGREIDFDTGLTYYRARWYDPQQGRFISEDPLELDAGINFYAYVNNSPLALADPLGLCAEDKKKPKCKQDKTGVDGADIVLLLRRAGLKDLIDNIRPSTVNPEGITFNIIDRQAFLDVLKKNSAFKYDTPYNTEHYKDVGKPAIDNRSVTGDKGLGEDTHGVDRSLQVVVGPGNKAGGATGYADLDCDNPAQGPVKALKHGLPILGRRIRRIFN